MKKEFKGFVVGFLVCLLLTIGVFADGAQKNIDVLFNSLNINVNGEKVEIDNIAYNGTTYAPVRAVAEMLGKEVGWNGETMTVSINDPIVKEENIEQEQQESTTTDKQESNADLLMQLRNDYKEAGFEIGDIELVAYNMVNASSGFKFNVDGQSIEIYQYDLDNLSKESAKTVEQAKEGFVTMSGFTFSCEWNDKGIMLFVDDEHNKKDEILEIFKNF